MLIWANKNEINIELMRIIELMYNKKPGIVNLENTLKAWELSIIFRQIQKYFGGRKDVSILDFGAGGSAFGAFLNRIGYQNVTCLDSPKAWHPEINQETYNKKFNSCVKYIKTNVTQGYAGKHDVVFSASVLEHIKKRTKILRSLSKSLKPDGLFIHVADYGRKINFKKLIDNCAVSISYKPEETPGCKEFKRPSRQAWVINEESRIAFFNERKIK